MDITQLTDDELEAQREEIDRDPRKMRGCGKRKPGFLYQKEPKLFLGLTTPDTDRCGDPFPSPHSEPPAILLCEECTVRYGLKW